MFISFSSFSQIHLLTHKSEKITYKEYDALKYISSLDEKLLYSENVVRYYDNGTDLLYSIITTTKENSNTKILLYPTGTIEYITTVIGSESYLRHGNLKINGVNNFLSLSSCNNKECYYWVFVNNEVVYKGAAK